MKKFLTVLLVIAVMFTFSFGSAFAYEIKTTEDTTTLITLAQTELSNAKTKLDSVQNYYMTNYVVIDTLAVKISKEAVETIIDDVFAAIDAEMDKAYETAVKDINDGEVVGTALADAKATVKAYFADAYGKYDTIEEITTVITSTDATRLQAKEFYKAALKAEFNIQVEDALDTLNQVNYDNYSAESPEAPTYDTNYYYSVQQIAKKIVDDAVKAIKAVEFDASTVAADLSTISGKVSAAVEKNTEGVYLVKTDGKAAASVVSSGKLVTVSEEAKTEKSLEDEVAYQKSVLKGTAALKEAALRKALAADLETHAKDAEKVKKINAAIDALSGNLENVLTVWGVQLENKETVGEVATAGAGYASQLSGLTLDASWETNLFKECNRRVAAVEEVKALAAKKEGQTGFDGKPVYSADAIAAALKADIKAIYLGGTAEKVAAVVANSDLVKAEMARVLSGADVTLNKVVYKTVAKWDLTVFEGDYKEEAEAIIAETKAAIRAAKTVADVDAAFVAGFEKFDAVTKIEVKTKYQALATTDAAENKYEALLDAAMAAKKAEYGSKFDTDYDLKMTDGTTYDLVDKIAAEFDKAYDAAELEAMYKEGLAVIEGLKTKAERAADAKAINDDILAIVAPVTAADEAKILELDEKADDFADYEEQIVVNAKQTIYTDLLNQYVGKVQTLSQDDIDAAIKAIGTVTVEDAAAIEEVAAAIDAHNDKYDANYKATELAKLESDLAKAQKTAVEEAIAAIDASADPLDKEAIYAAREAYDALGEEQIDSVMYAKLLSLENLVGPAYSDADAQAYVQDLDIKARSVKTAKGNVKVTIVADVEELIENGYTVEYKFYRSTKARANYGKAKITKAENVYTNTAGKKGVQYFYKAKLVVKNAAGEEVAVTPLTQCKYATRVWSK